jgi:hypothetical protein
MVASPTNLRDHMIVVTGDCGGENRTKFEWPEDRPIAPRTGPLAARRVGEARFFLRTSAPHSFRAFPAKKGGTPLYSVIFAIAANCMNDVPS